MKVRSVSFLMIAVASFAVSQEPLRAQRSAIKLGMSGSDVRSILGTPQAYRQRSTTRYTPSSSVGVLPPSTEYYDVYEIKTSMNTYQLTLQYAWDGAESRLHPVPRVIQMDFELDKRVRTDDVGQPLDDIPEVALLCGVECTVAGNGGRTSYLGKNLLILHPRTITSAEMGEAELIGSLFGKYPADGRSGPRKPTASVFTERGLITAVQLSEDDGYGEGPVQTTWKPQGPAN
jgi:hypothetical protein